jgi:hypothetical protein
MSLPSLSEVYARWHNPNHGFEKHPDINDSKGVNDRGLLDHCIFIFILKAKEMERSECYNYIYYDMNSLYSDKTGVYFSNTYDKYRKSKDIKDNIVENYLGISLASIMGRYYPISKTIGFRAKKSFGVFSSKIKTIPFSLPSLHMLLYCSGDYFFSKLLKPFFIFMAFFYCFFKKSFLEKKIIYFIFLFNFKYDFEILYNFYVKRLTKMYGEDFIHSILKNYYENKNHPSILYSKDVTFQEIKRWKPK